MTNGRIGRFAQRTNISRAIAQRTMQRSTLEPRAAVPGLLMGPLNTWPRAALQTKRASSFGGAIFLKYAMVLDSVHRRIC